MKYDYYTVRVPAALTDSLRVLADAAIAAAKENARLEVTPAVWSATPVSWAGGVATFRVRRCRGLKAPPLTRAGVVALAEKVLNS